MDVAAASDDTQRMFDMVRRGLAAAAVDELATACDLMADVAREMGAPIEDDLRAAKRLIDMTYDDTCTARSPKPGPVQRTLFDARAITEFAGWRPE